MGTLPIGLLVDEGGGTAGAGSYPWRLEGENNSTLRAPCTIFSGETCWYEATGAYVDCKGITSYYDDSAYADWWTADTSIATVDDSVNKGQVQGISPGAITAYASFTNNGYSPTTCTPTPLLYIAHGPLSILPRVSITCTLQHLALGPTAPYNTSTGDRTTTSSPSGGAFNWSANSNKVTLNPYLGTTTYAAASPSSSNGDISITVAHTVNFETSGAQSSPITVHQPTNLSVTNDTGSQQNLNSNALFALNYNGVQRNITYQARDIMGAVPIPGLPAVENFSFVSNTCRNTPNVPTPGNGQTLNDGTFNGPDQLGLCSPSCLPADPNGNPTGQCQLTFTQTWSVAGQNVQTRTITMMCTGVSIQ